MPAGLTSPVHLFVIIFVALIVLGPEKLPQALRQVGRTMGEVRRWTDTISSEMRGVLSLDAGDDSSGDPPTASTAPAALPNGNGASAPVAPQPPSVPEPVAAGPERHPDADDRPRPHPALRQGGEWH